MKSHIQISKSILKKYSHTTPDGKKVRYLDLSDNCIKESKINELDTALDYYSEEAENKLRDEAETPFGDIAKLLIEFQEKKIDEITLTKEDNNTILKFLNYAYLRSQHILKEANKYDNYTHDEIIMGTQSNFFSGRMSHFISNKTKLNFVIPKNCFYFTSSRVLKNELNCIFPFSPKSAIILLKYKEFKDFIADDGVLEYPKIDDDQSIRNLNIRALNAEISIDNKFIVGIESDLEELRNYIISVNSSPNIGQ